MEEKEAEAARKIEARNQRRAHARLANLDMSPKPTEIPDTTLITLTLLVDPPPLYDMVRATHPLTHSLCTAMMKLLLHMCLHRCTDISVSATHVSLYKHSPLPS